MRKMLIPYISIFLFVTFKVCSGQDVENCESKATCGQCIQERECVWCIHPINQQDIHCIRNTSNVNKLCQDLISPESSISVTENKSLRSTEKNEDEAVQISPQRIQLTLRKGEKATVDFQYRQAKNYPVDLYYIMDLSWSMEPHKEKLGKLGKQLADTMKNLTSSFRLGFGSFVDKVELPFTSTVPEKLKHPCKGCVSPYSFKNHLSLTGSHEEFAEKVTAAKVSGNLDSPEGGLDAIMQAIVCKQEIGWRPNARHLLVFSTDADFHTAGDGKLAGVIEPNDAKCHMTDHLYTDYLIYDYPSVSHVNYVAKENNVNLIFAIVHKDYSTAVTETYKKLSEHIENSNMGVLSDNSQNVVKLVVDNYNKIVNSITITSNATSDVDVKISPKCRHPKANGCTNVHVDEIVDFTATIEALECSSTEVFTKKFIEIKPTGLKESLILELNVICNCLCAVPSHVSHVKSATACSQQGDLECGICHCHDNRLGKKCECDSSQVEYAEDTSTCRANNETEICSGLGTCKCGQCECNKRSNPKEVISGQFCECNNYSCKRENGELCSGAANGECMCGECKCKAGWKGVACQCPDNNSTCIAPGTNLVCSGHGRCDCGTCECVQDDFNRYSGKFCGECTSCPAQRCDELRPCVECQAYNSGAYDNTDCLIHCTTFKTEIVEKLADGGDDVKKCRVPDKHGCTILFQYKYDKDNQNQGITVQAEKERLCAAPANILAWVLGVVGSIVIAGLLMLIIWKICTEVHDKKEYAKFENERKAMRWHNNDNPLYRQAQSTFVNPVYNRSSSRSDGNTNQ